MKQILLVFAIILPFSACSLTIDSDKLSVNLKEKNATFTGNVKINDDKLDFIADVVEVILDEKSNDLSKVKSATAYMNKGELRGSIKSDNTTYNFLAKKVEIDLITNQVIIDDASLEDGVSHIKGDKIIYDMKTDVVSASADKGNKVKISISNGSKKVQ